MEEEGLVVSTWEDAEVGRGRRTYEITDEGEALLDAWVASLERTASIVTTFVEAARRGPGQTRTS